MTFVPADTFSLIAFLLILASVLGAFFAGTWVASGGSAKATLVTGAATLLWFGLLALPVGSGWIAQAPMPRLFLLVGPSLLAAALFALSPLGARLASGVPLAALVAFQGFRLPLELVLHSWAEQGTIPGTMTWGGSNFDILSGILALVLAPIASRSRAAAWLANTIGLFLLLNVIRVAVLSSPLPFAWQVLPPLQLGLHLPYAWIVPVCVGGALAGHIVLTRALLGQSLASSRG